MCFIPDQATCDRILPGLKVLWSTLEEKYVKTGENYCLIRNVIDVTNSLIRTFRRSFVTQAH